MDTLGTRRQPAGFIATRPTPGTSTVEDARGYNVIQYKDSVIPDQNYVWSYAGIRSHNYYKSDLEDLSVLDHIL